MKLILLASLAALAPGSPELGATSRALPWLHNFAGAVAVEGGEPGEPSWFDDEVECPADAYPPLRLSADVAPAAGVETIVASLTRGMWISSAEGVPIAVMPGYPCEGTADELEVLAVGTAFHEPTIVLAATAGGRREQVTWLGMYRIGFGGRIDAVFAGVVEQRVDGIVRRGSVTFIPGALLYRPPGGVVSLWVFDPIGGAYVPSGRFDRDPVPHS